MPNSISKQELFDRIRSLGGKPRIGELYNSDYEIYYPNLYISYVLRINTKESEFAYTIFYDDYIGKENNFSTVEQLLRFINNWINM